MKENSNLFSRLAILLFPIAAFILELLPMGAVCIFAPNPTDRVKETFSYFNLTPFGYANFGPFITAILTCLLLAAIIAVKIKQNVKIRKCAFVISLVSAVTSLFPLILGIENCSIVGAGITLCLVAEALFLKSAKVKTSLKSTRKEKGIPEAAAGDGL